MSSSMHKTALALAILVVAALGCGGPTRPQFAKVSGVVLYQGKPVEGAAVTFQNDTAPRAATGTTDKDGRFKLQTFENFDGAIPGEHKVTIAKTKGNEELSKASVSNPTAAYGQGMMAAAKGKTQDFQKNELPPKYADVKTSGLVRTVTKDKPNEFEFKLD